MSFSISSESKQTYMDYAASVITNKQGEQTMTSLQIAEITGKQHAHIMRDVRSLLEQGVQESNFGLSYTIRELPNGGSKQEPYYILTKKGCLILASGYNALLREKIIDRWEVLEQNRSIGDNLNELTKARIFAVQFVKNELRLNDASYLGLLQQVTEPLGLILPQYVPSQGVMKSARELLKEIGSDMSAIKFNQLLVGHGYLETLTRPTAVKTVVKKFKSITDKGKPYGENIVSPKNQNETQPHWYADKFRELYSLVTIHS